MPLTNTVEVYKYSNAMLKHMPDDALEVLRYDLLYSKKKVELPADEDKQDYRTSAGGDNDRRTDDNLEDRIDKFQDQIQETRYYRIPLKYRISDW